MKTFSPAATAFLAAALLLSCTGQQVEQNTYFATTETGVLTGGVKIIPINTPAGTFKVWTKRIGHNPRLKLLLLHGGPGATHEYWECMESFLPKEGIEFIYYDQLGSAYSDQPQDTSLWNTARFVDELEQVRTALGLKQDNFYLLGHSWGGILAMEYALKHQQHLKGLIISNMMASAPKYDAYAEEVLAKKMDPAVLAEVRGIEAKGDFQNPRYMELLLPNFYNQFICRLPLAEWPDPMMRAFNKINHTIYVMMQGPSEFGISGKLEQWDVSAELRKITVPTLVIGARHDTMDPAHMKWMAEQVQNGSFLLCENGSHMCMWDDQQTYMNGLIKFLKAVDRGEKKVAL
ncbi:MAG: proline iminopeptidase-family hydrolase [candidate division KSB1 bacterium]|nr:proline iminopeptidase-family hydrolase [candidate division KSB1 bacterium]MDZ7274650.1 proline iminopeptidase-family hydrolase [candidate division KSB1 bacterium]MDZ7285475.1 proline iminopeptidase-family hydrolase [candidate division KSB1 bacterium]MDZ7298507.1 proline iminopeptidase-family hydrolase [candidate division KSB1 bacterium]MDZ7306269.1 proline iminopeptidase-family hydrolase [candidate division KSB1 bacterium]